ncbi:MAG: HPP family protein, partial [Acinetobacter junii]
MSSTRSDWLNLLKPNYKVLPIRERLLSAIGALCGLAISSLLSWHVLDGMNAWYIAPMGASSVLLFALPSSPLAQPWNVIIGNTDKNYGIGNGNGTDADWTSPIVTPVNVMGNNVSWFGNSDPDQPT